MVKNASNSSHWLLDHKADSSEDVAIKKAFDCWQTAYSVPNIFSTIFYIPKPSYPVAAFLQYKASVAQTTTHIGTLPFCSATAMGNHTFFSYSALFPGDESLKNNQLISHLIFWNKIPSFSMIWNITLLSINRKQYHWLIYLFKDL